MKWCVCEKDQNGNIVNLRAECPVHGNIVMKLAMAQLTGAITTTNNTIYNDIKKNKNLFTDIRFYLVLNFILNVASVMWMIF
jgi:hypothetical protein